MLALLQQAVMNFGTNRV